MGSFTSRSLLKLSLIITVPATHASEMGSTTERTSVLSSDIRTDQTITFVQPPNMARGYNWQNALSYSGLLESESDHKKVDGKLVNSGLVVATVALSAEATLSNRVSSELVLLYEEGDSRFGVDVFVFDFASTAASLTIGRTYLPFGAFDTNMVSDTLILEMAEANEAVAIAGIDIHEFSSQFYIFKGDSSLDANGNHGLRLSYSRENLSLGIDYLSNVLDSDGFSAFLAETLVGERDLLDSSVNAFAAHARYNKNRFSILGEALSVVRLGTHNTGGALIADQNVSSIQVELSYAYSHWGLAFGYQTSHDTVFLGLPENRSTVAFNLALHDKAHFAMELSHDENYALAEGGSGGNEMGALLQFSLSF